MLKMHIASLSAGSFTQVSAVEELGKIIATQQDSTFLALSSSAYSHSGPGVVQHWRLQRQMSMLRPAGAQQPQISERKV